MANKGLSKAQRQALLRGTPAPAPVAAAPAPVAAAPAPVAAAPAPVAPAAPAPVASSKGASTAKRWQAGSTLGDATLLPKAMGGTDQKSVITLLVSNNPKRRGSATRFAKYVTGMTVEAYIAAVGSKGLALADIAWDINHGFITVAAPVAAAPAEEPQEQPVEPTEPQTPTVEPGAESGEQEEQAA